ncbi:hypothetical protein [Capnocytophaga sp. H2931]|nr:hypothetical protein [Capnocytophaga sp. H2931]
MTVFLKTTHTPHTIWCILKNQYKQDSILRRFTRGDWISFNDILSDDR